MLLASNTVAEPTSFELVGARGAPVIAVLGGISATRHVCSSESDERPGWWEPMVGPGRALDLAHVQILGIDWLDGGRRNDGRPARIVTTHDQAGAIVAILDSLGILRVRAIVGSSYGGMVALAFAERYPERVEQLVVIAAAHETHPMMTAVRSIQRRIVELGLETGHAHEALSLARELAMTTYRSAREFAERFSGGPVALTDNNATFPVEQYLRHHGEKFADAWRAERFVALSLSGDLHRVDPDRIITPAVFVAAEGDSVVPREQIAALAASVRGPAELVDLPSDVGHDAFLTEHDALDRMLASALSTSDLTESIQS